MNLTGSWTGKYSYGKGYPRYLIGKSEVFEFDIKDKAGIFTGTCIDQIVKTIPGNESKIEGVFKDNFISFIKRYKYNSFIEDPETENFPIADIKFDGVHYTGHLFKKLFSRKVYFKGEWTITSEYRDRETNELIVYTIEGSWTMQKA